ncbi:MAG: cupin domain-containing protein [Rubrimonas sp.]
MSRPQAVGETLVDDERVRVTRFTFAPGAETGWHVHGMDYVIVALTDLAMRLEEPGGTHRDTLIPAGSSYRKNQGVEHNVLNIGDAPMAFVEIELKEPR